MNIPRLYVDSFGLPLGPSHSVGAATLSVPYGVGVVGVVVPSSSSSSSSSNSSSSSSYYESSYESAIDVAWAEAEAWVEGLSQAEELAWANFALSLNNVEESPSTPDGKAVAASSSSSSSAAAEVKPSLSVSFPEGPALIMPAVHRHLSGGARSATELRVDVQDGSIDSKPIALASQAAPRKTSWYESSSDEEEEEKVASYGGGGDTGQKENNSKNNNGGLVAATPAKALTLAVPDDESPCDGDSDNDDDDDDEDDDDDYESAAGAVGGGASASVFFSSSPCSTPGSPFPLSSPSQSSSASGGKPPSQTPSPHHSLHDKLSSPERRRPSPAETKAKMDGRAEAAAARRAQQGAAGRLRLRQAAEKIERARESVENTNQQRAATLSEKMRAAEEQAQRHLQAIVAKAESANTKVEEISFINAINGQSFEDELEIKMLQIEKRINAARERRRVAQEATSSKNEKRRVKNAQTICEKDVERERQQQERWEALQIRIKAVNERRNERLMEVERLVQLKREKMEEAATRRQAMEEAVLQKSAEKEQRRSAAEARRSGDFDAENASSSSSTGSPGKEGVSSSAGAIVSFTALLADAAGKEHANEQAAASHGHHNHHNHHHHRGERDNHGESSGKGGAGGGAKAAAAASEKHGAKGGGGGGRKHTHSGTSSLDNDDFWENELGASASDHGGGGGNANALDHALVAPALKLLAQIDCAFQSLNRDDKKKRRKRVAAARKKLTDVVEQGALKAVQRRGEGGSDALPVPLPLPPKLVQAIADLDEAANSLPPPIQMEDCVAPTQCTTVEHKSVDVQVSVLTKVFERSLQSTSSSSEEDATMTNEVVSCLVRTYRVLLSLSHRLYFSQSLATVASAIWKAMTLAPLGQSGVKALLSCEGGPCCAVDGAVRAVSHEAFVMLLETDGAAANSTAAAASSSSSHHHHVAAVAISRHEVDSSAMKMFTALLADIVEDDAEKSIFFKNRRMDMIRYLVLTPLCDALSAMLRAVTGGNGAVTNASKQQKSGGRHDFLSGGAIPLVDALASFFERDKERGATWASITDVDCDPVSIALKSMLQERVGGGLVSLIASILPLAKNPNSYDVCQDNAGLSSQALRALVSVGKIDLKRFQLLCKGEHVGGANAWEGGGGYLEFNYMCGVVLGGVGNLVGKGGKWGDFDECVKNCIVLLGYYCINNQNNQQRLHWGGPSVTLLGRLSSLPFKFFCDPVHKEILFPTLVSACAGNETNRKLIESDLNPELLACYLREKLDNVKSESSVELSRRVPLELWKGAMEFFEKTTVSSSV